MKIFIFFLLLVISGRYFILEVYGRFRAVKLGRPENRSDHPGDRWRYFYSHVLLHKKIRKYPIFGLWHGFMMWGFLILLFSNLDMAMAGLFRRGVPWIGNNIGYLFIRDCLIILVVIGVIGSILRRIVKKPDWMHNSLMSFIILALILVIVISELFFEANPDQKSVQTIKELLWWIHFIAIFALLFIIPRSKHLHFVFAPFNTYWHPLEPKGSLMPVQFNGENEKIYGVSKPEDFTWKQLFDAFSCVKCGRCHGSCPAFQSGEYLKIKKLNGRLRAHLESRQRDGFLVLRQNTLENLELKNPVQNNPEKKSKKELVAGVFEEESLWSCTTCGACEDACPVSCEHMSKIIDMRRYLVSAEENISPEIKQVFSGIENYGNPWGIKRSRNTEYAWAQELGLPTFAEKPTAQYLYYVGCTPAYEPSAQKTAAAFARILKIVGVDFAILGEEEQCCGETSRRLGNEFLFQDIVKRNISTWKSYGIKKIITTCPHCFNTLHNEYPQLGGDYEVIPHAAFLTDLLRMGKLKPEKYQSTTVTFHDSCYLGRFNGYYDEPREILKAIPGVNLVEMPRTREDSFCCGAGGGRFWSRKNSDNKISKNRVQEALDTGSEMIATACPYCRIVMQEEIGRSLKQEVSTIDIVEILEASL